MDPNWMSLTLVALFTAGGAMAAAAVVRQLIELLKVAIPSLDAKVSGALLAFVLSLALYGAAWVAVGSITPEGAFAAFLSWLACATAAVGINSTVDHYRTTRG